MKKQLYCRYDTCVDYENATVGLNVFVPACKGYINYNIVHSVNGSSNCDVWRIGKAFACDDKLENAYAITLQGAEWDMALKLQGRNDFIGGYAHGDEVYTAFSAWIDGKCVQIASLRDVTAFEEMILRETSVGYDPDDHTTKVLTHEKEYVINQDGITLHQKVEWLNGYTLGSSYMAMMPPLKTLTDSYCVKDDTPVLIDGYDIRVPNCTEAVVSGSSSGFRFSMGVPKYPSLKGGDTFLLTDNNGGGYNKMYFVICNGASVAKGDVWETTTQYKITNG